MTVFKCKPLQIRGKQQIEHDRKDAEKENVEKVSANELYQQQQTQILAMHHPDWEKITASKEFTNWRNTLSLATNKTLDTTWDGVYLSETMSAFKEYKARNNKH